MEIKIEKFINDSYLGNIVGLKDKYQSIGIILSLIIGGMAIYLQINPPQSPQARTLGNLFFFAVFFFIVVYFVVDWIAHKINLYIKRINDNYNDIQEIKKHLNITKKGKKSQIDPRIIILIILIILIYFYLKSIGYIK